MFDRRFGVYFFIVYNKPLLGFFRNPLRKRFFGYQKWKKDKFSEVFFRKSSKTHRKQLNLQCLTEDHSVYFFNVHKKALLGFLRNRHRKRFFGYQKWKKVKFSSKTQRRFIVFVNSGQTKWRGRLKFCMRLRNRYKYHVSAAHTSSQKSTVFFLTFSLDFQKFFRKSSKTHRKQQNIQYLTENRLVYFF